MKKIISFGWLFLAGICAFESMQAAVQDDTKVAFQKIASGDYMGMSKIVKKYTDAVSIKTMLTTKNNEGKTLLQAAANVKNTTTALQMAARILDVALLVSKDFQKQVIQAKDNTNKTANDYANANKNTQLVSLFSTLTSSGSAAKPTASTSTPTTGSTSTTSTPAQTQTSTSSLQSDIDAAFQKIAAGDYMGMSKIVKKYTDATSIKTILTAKNSAGKTLLHAAASVSNPSVATQMASRITNQAIEVSSDFQKQVIQAKDNSNKTPSDYAAANSNSQLVNLFSTLITPAPTPAPAPSSTTGSTLEADIDLAFQKIAASDYMGMSTIVKKYTDAPSVQEMLTTQKNGMPLLHAAAAVPDTNTSAMMVGRIVGQAMQVGRDFQLQIMTAKDSQGKTPIDYATANNNSSVVDLLTSMLQK